MSGRVIGVVVGAVVLSMFYYAMPPVTNRAAERALKASEMARRDNAIAAATMMSVAEARISERMKDPGSVQFRGVAIYTGAGSPVVCGEVNAKNSFGGYSGFQPFLGAGERVVVPSDMAPGKFAREWAKMCR